MGNPVRHTTWLQIWFHSWIQGPTFGSHYVDVVRPYHFADVVRHCGQRSVRPLAHFGHFGLRDNWLAPLGFCNVPSRAPSTQSSHIRCHGLHVLLKLLKRQRTQKHALCDLMVTVIHRRTVVHQAPPNAPRLRSQHFRRPIDTGAPRKEVTLLIGSLWERWVGSQGLWSAVARQCGPIGWVPSQ